MALIDQAALNRQSAQRLVKILALRNKGWTLEAIGAKFMISKQRVSSIVRKVQK